MDKEYLEILHSLELDVEKYDESFFQRMVEKRIAELGGIDWMGYVLLLQKDPVEIRKLKEYLTVSYTEFFRNSYTFSVIERIVLPVLLKNSAASGQREIRIWSAACAAGQEAYSISMLFHENILSDTENMKFRIFGTDVDPEQVELATKAEYSRTNLNHVTLQRLSKWFVKKGAVYCLQDTIKRCVDFSFFDLLDNDLAHPPVSIFGGFDMVLCANILFYYNRETQKEIINKVNNSLCSSGFLVVGETERDILQNEGFVELIPHSAIFKKK